MEAEDEKNMEGLSFVPSAVSEPRWALQKCDNKCRAQCFKLLEVAAIVSHEGVAAHTMNLCKKCCNGERAKQGETEVAGSSGRR